MKRLKTDQITVMRFDNHNEEARPRSVGGRRREARTRCAAATKGLLISLTSRPRQWLGPFGRWTSNATLLIPCLCLFVAMARAGSTIPPREPVALTEQFEVDGAKLYVEIRGNDARAPLLIWLHGGPGGAERPLFRFFNSDLERRFLVVYYDQRGAGLSFDTGATAASLTIARHLADLDRLIEHLRSRYRQNHILLIGHSWGTVLGMLYARDHPDKIIGLVAVAPVVSFDEQRQREFAWDIEEAKRRDDVEALRDLHDIGPPPYSSPAPMLRLQRVTERFNGVEFHPRSHWAIVVEGLIKGLVGPIELYRIVQGNHRSLEAMHKELQAFDMRREVLELRTPAFVFLGRHDRHVDAKLADQYFNSLRAPMKEIIWFEDSAHDIPFEEPELFDQRVVDAARALGALPD